MLDQTDLSILALLRENSRLQWKDIGERGHLSGQAVGNRIRRMEEQGIIQGYTARIDEARIGRARTAIVTMFMKTNVHRPDPIIQRFPPGATSAFLWVAGLCEQR